MYLRFIIFNLLAASPLMVSAQAMEYPVSPKKNIVDDYYGISISDPYQWLENAESPETIEWTQAQNRFTRNYLESIPVRNKIQNELTELWDFDKFSPPVKYGDWYYLYRMEGTENQNVIYRVQALDDEPELIFDTNTLSKDGTAALNGHYFSDNGNLLAYVISRNGSDWKEVRIRDIETGKDFEDVIRWVKYSGIAWNKDQSGFYYFCYPIPKDASDDTSITGGNVYFHQLGTSQNEDQPITEIFKPSPYPFTPLVTHDGQYLLLFSGYRTSSNYILYQKLNGEKQLEFLFRETGTFRYIGNEGKTFYFLTTVDAPNGKIVEVNLNQPHKEHWQTIIPETESSINHAMLVHQQFVIQYQQDAYHAIKAYDVNGTFLKEIDLPSKGSTGWSPSHPNDDEFFYRFNSYIHPPTIFRYDFETETSELIQETALEFDPSNYVSEQIFYSSKDGSKIPMMISYRKDIVRDGNTPTILHGYGGHGITTPPAFYVHVAYWLKQGGIYAVPNIRGGGVYGKSWGLAGSGENKQNSFDDFQAAAEWLIQNHYTNPNRLAIEGRSTGGLLVAACMLQRPELFGAVLCHVPVTDLLRDHHHAKSLFHDENGSIAVKQKEFESAYAYSPLHNIKTDMSYPPILVTTAEYDDRVLPSNAKKFVAALQEVSGNMNPILLRIEPKAGHGYGKPTSKQIGEYTDIYTFLFKQFGMTLN